MPTIQLKSQEQLNRILEQFAEAQKTLVQTETAKATQQNTQISRKRKTDEQTATITQAEQIKHKQTKDAQKETVLRDSMKEENEKAAEKEIANKQALKAQKQPNYKKIKKTTFSDEPPVPQKVPEGKSALELAGVSQILAARPSDDETKSPITVKIQNRKQFEAILLALDAAKITLSIIPMILNSAITAATPGRLFPPAPALVPAMVPEPATNKLVEERLTVEQALKEKRPVMIEIEDTKKPEVYNLLREILKNNGIDIPAYKPGESIRFEVEGEEDNKPAAPSPFTARGGSGQS